MLTSNLISKSTELPVLAQREPEHRSDYCDTPINSLLKSDDDFVSASRIDNSDAVKAAQNDHLNVASPSSITEHSGEASDNFALGALFYVMSMGFSAGQSILGKVLYTAQPGLTPYQLLAYRAIFSTTINGLSINVDAYEVLWKSIPTGCGFQLFFRVLQQNLSTFITFYSIH